MLNISEVGSEWLAEEVEGLTDHLEHLTPVEYNEATRYLPASVTPMPGFISYEKFPYMREILNCFDVDNDVREVNLKKGVQVAFTTLLESGILYFMDHVKTAPVMLMTADKELAHARVENNILPMLQQSGLEHILQSSDEGNARKSGKTANHLQWAGGYMVPFGAINAGKMRSFSIRVLLKDELDAWPDTVGRDGDPDKLSDARTTAYEESRKIFRGSTPLLKGSSKIEKAYNRGDQRKYTVKCLECKHPQILRWSGRNEEKEFDFGIIWDYDEDGQLDVESVRYACSECGHQHHEHDKDDLFAEENGAHWKPTAKAKEPGVRSYHLPGLYSPASFKSWAKCVMEYLEGFDPVSRRVTDVGKYQVFYNNVLGEPFEVRGSKVRFESVSAHRRAVYRLGEVPNNYAVKWSSSRILFLTCTVDVHKSNLAVAVIGWTADARAYVVDYWRFEDEDCTELSSPVWQRLRDLIESKTYTADDGTEYQILITLVDAGYSHDTVNTFCSDYASGVYPILGRERAAKSQKIQEFGEFTTKIGTRGFMIVVDNYKDRLAPVLRREWHEDRQQDTYQFNAPVDITDAQLKELTVETRRKKVDARGSESYEWHRPGGVKNELWDLLVYGSAAVEILAWDLCVKKYEMETVEWPQFWEYMENSLNTPENRL